MKTLSSPFHEFFKKGDPILLLLCLLASAFGVALIFSATRYNENNQAVVIQIVAILLGVVAYILCTFIDFQLFVEKNWKLIFWGSAATGTGWTSPISPSISSPTKLIRFPSSFFWPC